MVEATVGFLQRGEAGTEKILLGERASLFCNGTWNGPGGKRKAGESIVQCLARELREEVGVRINKATATHISTNDCRYPKDGKRALMRVYFFIVTEWSGTPRPLRAFSQVSWFPKAKLPFDIMHVDQETWLPLAFKMPRETVMKVSAYYMDPELRNLARGTYRFEPRNGQLLGKKQ